MQDLNEVRLIGRVTRDGEMKDYNGSSFLAFSIAVNNTKKDGEKYVDEANFFNITVWGKAGVNLQQYITKGQQVCVQGHLKQTRKEKDGQTISQINIVTDHIQLLGSRNKGDQNNAVQSLKDSGLVAQDAEAFQEDIPF